MKKELAPIHTSQETAYLVDDYPYGFRLRCKIRYWVETKKGFGQRFVSQTTNPKRDNTTWNKPKCGQYAPLIALYLDEQNHLHAEVLLHRGYGDASYITQFQSDFPLTCETEFAKKQIFMTKAMAKAAGYITYEIHKPGTPEQTREEAYAIQRKALSFGIRAQKQEDLAALEVKEEV